MYRSTMRNKTAGGTRISHGGRSVWFMKHVTQMNLFIGQPYIRYIRAYTALLKIPKE